MLPYQGRWEGIEAECLYKSPALLSQPALVLHKASRLCCRAELARSSSLIQTPHSDAAFPACILSNVDNAAYNLTSYEDQITASKKT